MRMRCCECRGRLRIGARCSRRRAATAWTRPAARRCSCSPPTLPRCARPACDGAHAIHRRCRGARSLPATVLMQPTDIAAVRAPCLRCARPVGNGAHPAQRRCRGARSLPQPTDIAAVRAPCLRRCLCSPPTLPRRALPAVSVATETRLDQRCEFEQNSNADSEEGSSADSHSARVCSACCIPKPRHPCRRCVLHQSHGTSAGGVFARCTGGARLTCGGRLRLLWPFVNRHTVLMPSTDAAALHAPPAHTHGPKTRLPRRIRFEDPVASLHGVCRPGSPPAVEPPVSLVSLSWEERLNLCPSITSEEVCIGVLGSCAFVGRPLVSLPRRRQ